MQDENRFENWIVDIFTYFGLFLEKASYIVLPLLVIGLWIHVFQDGIPEILIDGIFYAIGFLALIVIADKLS